MVEKVFDPESFIVLSDLHRSKLLISPISLLISLVPFNLVFYWSPFNLHFFRDRGIVM